MVEMLVVMGIMLILTSTIISGYATMRRNAVLSHSFAKLQSIVYEARNLAISNNAMYCVRIDNADPNFQVASIYYFPNVNDATTACSRNAPDWQTALNDAANDIKNASTAPLRIDMEQLDMQTWFGCQDPSPSSNPPALVGVQVMIGFNADGTKIPNGVSRMFVVDDSKLKEDGSDATNVARMQKFKGGSLHVKMLKIYGGGMVKIDDGK